MGVLVRRQLQRHALVHRPAGQPVQLDPGHLEHGDAVVGRQLRMSRSRSSRSAPSATYADLAGMPACSASSTGLRPKTHSARPGSPVRGGRALRRRRGRARRPSWPGAPRGTAGPPPSGSGPCPPARGGPGRRSRRCSLAAACGWRPCAGCCPARLPARRRSSGAQGPARPAGCPRLDAEVAQAVADARPPRRSPSAPGPPARCSSSAPTSPSTTAISRRSSAPRSPIGSAASSPSTSSMPGTRPPRARRLPVDRRPGRVPVPDRVQHGHRRRGAEIVVHRGHERRRHGRRRPRRPARSPASTKLSIRARAAAASSSDVVGELDRRAVVRLGQVEPHRAGREALDHLRRPARRCPATCSSSPRPR